jgi:small subunit ribosomal protein S8
MLTRIRNANLAMKEQVTMPSSKVKEEIAKLLAAEGYVSGFEVAPADPGKELTVGLRYTEDRQRVLQGLRRVSTPGRRLYSSAADLPQVQGGLGVTIVSTSQGLLVDRECRRRKLGGEMICEVW